jgi:hypothetical protein
MIEHGRTSDKRIYSNKTHYGVGEVVAIGVRPGYLNVISPGVISRFHPDLLTVSLTHPVTHDTLRKAYKNKIRQQYEEGCSYVDFYPGA